MADQLRAYAARHHWSMSRCVALLINDALAAGGPVPMPVPIPEPEPEPEMIPEPNLNLVPLPSWVQP